MKVNFESLKKLGWMLSGVLVMLSMTSCLDENDGVEPEPVAYVSIFHASPDAPDLDVVLDSLPIFNQPLEYTDYTDYLRFKTGNRKLGLSEYNANNILTDTTVNFQADKAYSVFVVDEVADLSTLIVEDKADQPATGKAQLRLIQLSPDAPALDLVMGDEDSLLFTNQPFKQATNFTEVTADTYSLDVKATGENEDLVSVPDAEFKSGGIYTVIVRGFADTASGGTNALSVQIIQNQ